MIDLHLHTTASDGYCSPGELVARAAAAGLTTIAVTDHDTLAATAEVRRACAARGLSSIAGIEITAVESGRDVHVLGYFVNPADPALERFLSAQRRSRIARVETLAEKLASLGMPIDTSELMAAAVKNEGRSVDRPHVARAMVSAGHVADLREAFDRWLGHGCPAFVPRRGSPATEVIDAIHGAGGLASLAHPGQTAVDSRIPALHAAGLDALEAYHSDHTPEDRDRSLQMAASLGMVVTGGSDYHADPAHGIDLGSITLPQDAWERLQSRWQPHS